MRPITRSMNTQAGVESAKKAKAAQRLFARLSTEDKNRALHAISRSIADQADQILGANQKDLDAARLLVESGRMAEPLFRRLKLDKAKLKEMIAGVEEVASLEDPIGKVTLSTELAEGLWLSRISSPLGVLGVVFESRPDVLVQVSALAIKTGNAALLKGGREADHSNRALFQIIQSAVAGSGIPPAVLVLLESREDVAALLKADGFVDLIIPRGSNELVRYIQDNTNIPVLGHAEGICHVYVDREADLDQAIAITLDAKTQYPSACNAVETLLVHQTVAPEFLPRVVAALQNHQVEVRCEEKAIAEFGFSGVERATEQDWRTEYCRLIISIKIISSLEEAIEHINGYGSHHTDAIVTRDPAAWERFFADVDSAGVYLNTSTRFADGNRYGFGAEVGISTGKVHARGPVGLEGLTTYKYKLVGDGHVVANYKQEK